MNESEITALAREYAEEIHYGDNFFENENKRFLAWLTHRFCLVEKSKVKDIHKGILVQLDPKNFGYSPYNQGRMDLLKSLFPEITKEVQEPKTNHRSHENSWCENEL